MIRRLLLDTSSAWHIIGLSEGRLLRSAVIAPHHNQLHQVLLPTLEELLSQVGWSLDTLDEIAIGMGPGSYTGTRVGVSIAKALHMALALKGSSVQLRPFCSLLTFLPPIEGEFLCAMPSKTDLCYCIQGDYQPPALKIFLSKLLRLDEIVLPPHAWIGSPCTELPSLLPNGPWQHPLSPRIEPLLDYLDSTPLQADIALKLIYLHEISVKPIEKIGSVS